MVMTPRTPDSDVKPYPDGEDFVIDIGSRHFLMEWSRGVAPFEVVGYLWHHDGPIPRCKSWGWFGEKDGNKSGHRIVSTSPITVEGSLICPDCGDHGYVHESRWVKA